MGCRAAAAAAAVAAAAAWLGGHTKLFLLLPTPHLPAARREDAARLAAAAAEYESRLAAARAEWEAEKAQLARQQQREVERARAEHAVGQEAWRAAATERARREMDAREAALRKQLGAEQEEELRAVVGRLEEEALSREAAAAKQLAAAEAAAEERWRAEVARLRAGQAGAAGALVPVCPSAHHIQSRAPLHCC